MEKLSVTLLELSTTGLSTLGTEVGSVVANINNPIADIAQDWVIFNAPIHPAFPQQFNDRQDNRCADRSTYDRPIRQEVLLN